MLKEHSEGIYSFGKDGPDTVDSGFSVDPITLQLISMGFYPSRGTYFRLTFTFFLQLYIIIIRIYIYTHINTYFFAVPLSNDSFDKSTFC